MRNLVFVFFVLVIRPLFAQEPSKIINAKVESVTVYTNGAEIKHKVLIPLVKGLNCFTIKGIAKSLDPKSIRTKLDGDARIQSVFFDKKYTENTQDDSKSLRYQDSLKILALKLREINLDLNSYTEEKKLITQNNVLSGQVNGLLSSEVPKMADYYRNRFKELNQLIVKEEALKEKNEEQTDRINKLISESNPYSRQEIFDIIISINSDVSYNASLELKYQVYGAGWEPNYDIFAKDVSSPISLNYKARVYNNTGLDWPDVNMSLSTADPSQSAQKPRLEPWILNYKEQEPNEGYLNKQGYVATDALGEDKKGKMTVKNQSSTIEVSELSVDFAIKNRQTIPSNNRVYDIDIQTLEIPATYSYLAIPKIDKDAFLMAIITGWESLNLIEGVANIYYGGTYVGESYIDTRYANDTLRISLGRDKKVAITRTKKQDQNSKKLFGTTNKENFVYEISARNNNKVPIEIEIQDQVPVSQEDDIKVEITETSNAKIEEQSGVLKWFYKLEPSEAKLMTIGFNVSYPKTKVVKIRKSRKLQRGSSLL